MSDHPHAVEQPHAEDHAHPSARKYVQIAVILGLITAAEVGIYYVESIAAFLPHVLIGMSAVKFGIVAAYYMHLKFDHPLFAWFFVGGLALAGSVVLALMTLFGTWWQVGYPASH